MVKKKTWLGMLVLVLVFGVMVVGCTTTYPILYTDNPKKDFIVLGEVTYEGKVTPNGKANHGYLDLLQAAKEKFPETDYVIDIMIDGKETLYNFVFFGIWDRKAYKMRGTAIKYVNPQI